MAYFMKISQPYCTITQQGNEKNSLNYLFLLINFLFTFH